MPTKVEMLRTCESQGAALDFLPPACDGLLRKDVGKVPPRVCGSQSESQHRWQSFCGCSQLPF